MRRKDREVTDPSRILDILSRCHCCRLGFYDAGEVYIVPLNFGYTEQAGQLTFYFHSARQGRKIDLIARGQPVGLELDTDYALQTGPMACDYTAQFQSIIGTGTVHFVEDDAGKQAALRQIMLHNTGSADWDFSAPMLRAVCIFKLEVQTLTCKVHE